MASSASRTLLRPTTPLGERKDCLVACPHPLPGTLEGFPRHVSISRLLTEAVSST